MSLPDFSAKEEMIHVIGDVELLKKKGILTLRYKKVTWGTENDKLKYESLVPYFTGRILDIGLGMGNSVDVILESCTELVAYEMISDIIEMYQHDKEPNEKLTIIQENFYTHKPEGNFNTVLLELSEWVASEKDDILECIDWIAGHLEPNGCLILEHNPYNKNLVSDLTGWNYMELSEGQGLGKRITWMILTRS